MNYHLECNLLHFHATCPKVIHFFPLLYQFISCAACLIIWLTVSYSLWIHIPTYWEVQSFSHKCHFCLLYSSTYITTSEMSLLLHKGRRRRKNFWLKFWLLCYMCTVYQKGDRMEPTYVFSHFKKFKIRKWWKKHWKTLLRIAAKTFLF